jgi:hypothetical protein
MPAFADLQRAVAATLASKRLGQPVFVRLLLHGLDKAEAVPAKLAHAAAAARDWLGQPLTRLYAVGNPAQGQVALTLEFRDGATALVSWSHGPPRGDGLDLMLLGNRGALYHDTGAADAWDEPTGFPGEADVALLTAVERALRSPAPIALGGEP